MMNVDIINKFIAKYVLGTALDFVQLPLTTSGNITYKVTTDTGTYVVRTLVRQSAAGAEDEYTIQSRLNAAGIRTPLYLKTRNNAIVSTLNGEPAVVSKQLEGSRQSEDTLALAENMGAMLARIHLTLHDITLRPNEQQWFNPANAAIQLSRYKGPEKEYIALKTDEYAAIFEEDLPKAITHGDFHTNNIFSAADDVTAVFDFESAEYTVRILDIARLYLTYRKVTPFDPDKILNAILRGYDSTFPFGLTEHERAELKNAFIYVALISSVSIFNHGNTFSSEKYLEIVKTLIAT